MNRHVNEEIQMEIHIRCSMLLVMMEMQIKTMIWCYYTLIKIAKIKFSDNIQLWQGPKQLELSHIAGANLENNLADS